MTAHGAHCAAADDRGNAYVCDPKRGRLLIVHDTVPPSGQQRQFQRRITSELAAGAYILVMIIGAPHRARHLEPRFDT